MRCVATPSPGTHDAVRRSAACSSARTTVVPMAMTRPPAARAASIAAAVMAGMRYGSSNGSRASSAGSPVDEMPAASVIVANADAAIAHRCDRRPVEHEACRRRLERDRHAGDRRPRRPTARAAAARARTGSAGRAARGRPRPRQASRRSAASPAADGRAARRRSPTSGPSRSRSPGASGGGSGRSSVARAEVARAEDDGGERAASPPRRASGAPPAALRSRRRSARASPCRLAGSVAASLAIDEIAGSQQSRQIARAARWRSPARRRRAAARRRPLDGPVAGDHGATMLAARRAAQRRVERRRGGNRVGELARGGLRPLERRRIGVGHRQRVQRRVHVARIERQEADAFGGELLVPDAVMWRSAALLAPYAPQRDTALTAASLEMLSTTAPRPSRADAASAPSSALVRRNGPSDVGRERRARDPRIRCRPAARAAPARGSRRC